MPKSTPTPTNGITAEVIRDCMQPYGFNPDLLEDFVASLPPPPPEASAAWRLRHLTRLVQEVAIFMPADDAQARLATDVVGLRELAGVLRRRAVAPGVAVGEQCRLSRTVADVVRAALAAERQLDRRQHKPAPFFGTLLADPVDVGALDAVWRRGVQGMVVEAMASLPPDACPGGEAAGGDGGALVPRGADDDPRVAPSDRCAAATEPPLVADSAATDTEPMDRETAGRPADLTVVAVPGGTHGAASVAPEDERAASTGEAGVAGAAPRRAGVVVEQGDGWSLEVWPATRGAAAGDGTARTAAAEGVASGGVASNRLHGP
jgi:hypothetical protein